MAGLRKSSFELDCPQCGGKNVVFITRGPGGGWDEEIDYNCAHCNNPLGRRKAFAIDVEKPREDSRS